MNAAEISSITINRHKIYTQLIKGV